MLAKANIPDAGFSVRDRKDVNWLAKMMRLKPAKTMMLPIASFSWKVSPRNRAAELNPKMGTSKANGTTALGPCLWMSQPHSPKPTTVEMRLG